MPIEGGFETRPYKANESHVLFCQIELSLTNILQSLPRRGRSTAEAKRGGRVGAIVIVCGAI